LLFGEHAHFFDSRGADGVNRVHDGAVVSASIGAKVDDLAGFILKLVADLRTKIGDSGTWFWPRYTLLSRVMA
jgi:hypothetical protein